MERQGKNANPALKICGLTTVNDTLACLRLGVEYVGFNHYVHSKRFIEPEAASRIWRAAIAAYGEPVRTQPVAVVVDADSSEIERIVRTFPEVAALQFHGGESPADLAALRRHLGTRFLWKAVSVAAVTDVADAVRFEAADLILFDTKPASADPILKGGTGQRFDWTYLKAAPRHRPWGLAGGLNAANIKEAQLHGAVLLDVCSGIETKPGQKDPQQLHAVVTQLRAGKDG